MKIRYVFCDEEVEIDVSEHWGNIVLDLDRKEYNNDHKETRRHCSLDLINRDDSFFASDEDVESNVLDGIEAERLYSAIDKLTPRQKRLVEKVYFEDKSISEVAREEGRAYTTIKESLGWALKKLKNLLT